MFGQCSIFAYFLFGTALHSNAMRKQAPIGEYGELAEYLRASGNVSSILEAFNYFQAMPSFPGSEITS